MALSILVAGCPSSEGATERSSSASADVGSAKSRSSSAAPTSSAAARSAARSAAAAAPLSPPPSPSPVDLSKKVWTDGGASLSLATKDLSKVCLLKGVSMLLPEKAKITMLMGSRGCVIRPWGEDGPYIFVVNDELNFTLKPKADLKGIKRTVEETADSWLVEDDDPKTGFAGRVTRRLGDRVHWCNVNAHGKPNGEQIARGLVKLCSTMAYAAPSR